MKPKIAPTISEKAKQVAKKLKYGEPLTRGEKMLEVTREEAALLLSVQAERPIPVEYLRQLTRGETPRLVPSRATGNTYMYRVDALLSVQFTKPHKTLAEDVQEEQLVDI